MTDQEQSVEVAAAVGSSLAEQAKGNEPRVVGLVARLAARLDGIRATVGQQVVETEEQAADMVKIHREAKQLAKDAERDRKALTGPLKQQAKDIEAKYEPLESGAEALAKSANDKVMAYRAWQAWLPLAEAAVAAEALELEHAHDEEVAEEQGLPPPPPAPLPPVETMTAQPAKRVGGATVRETWTYSLIPGQEHLVPREFCVPSLGLIQNAVRDGVRDIPGVKIEKQGGLV